ncbi:MAG: hypothetical protein ACR2P6_04340, partial [Gammaproteobacteria bacterium]
MFKGFLKFGFFSLLVCVAIELTTRAYFLGSDGLLPHKTASYAIIFASGLIQTAEHPDVYYELKPNLDTLYRGERFRTNSAGMADKEYAIEKPADVYRIAVIGSSWTMPTGVIWEEAYHSVLEDRLNAESAGKRFEVLNFGVEYYGLGELLATTRRKALAYEPDMLLFTITQFTPNVKWEDEREPYVVPERYNAFFDLFAWTAIRGMLNLNWGN